MFAEIDPRWAVGAIGFVVVFVIARVILQSVFSSGSSGANGSSARVTQNGKDVHPDRRIDTALAHALSLAAVRKVLDRNNASEKELSKLRYLAKGLVGARVPINNVCLALGNSRFVQHVLDRIDEFGITLSPGGDMRTWDNLVREVAPWISQSPEDSFSNVRR